MFLRNIIKGANVIMSGLEKSRTLGNISSIKLRFNEKRVEGDISQRLKHRIFLG